MRQLLLGLVWAVGMAWLDLRFLFWCTDRLLVDPVTVCFGDFQPCHRWSAHQTLETVPIPEEYSPPQVLVDTDRFLEMNVTFLDDGFMHAVFNPSFNALVLQWRPRVTAPVRCWKSPVITSRRGA